jgi:hypothetical protein
VSNQQENEQHHFGQTWPQMFHNRIVDLNELLLLHMFWKREELRRARLDEWNVTYEVRMLLTVNSVATTATIKHDNTNNTPDSFISSTEQQQSSRNERERSKRLHRLICRQTPRPHNA